MQELAVWQSRVEETQQKAAGRGRGAHCKARRCGRLATCAHGHAAYDGSTGSTPACSWQQVLLHCIPQRLALAIISVFEHVAWPKLYMARLPSLKQRRQLGRWLRCCFALRPFVVRRSLNYAQR